VAIQLSRLTIIEGSTTRNFSPVDWVSFGFDSRVFAPWNDNSNKPLLAFVALLVATWFVVLITSVIHGDIFPHSFWTEAPILV